MFVTVLKKYKNSPQNEFQDGFYRLRSDFNEHSMFPFDKESSNTP